MKISDIVDALLEIKQREGDLEVCTFTDHITEISVEPGENADENIKIVEMG